MKIIYKQGDMFKGPERWYLHGCNAKGVMGSGVAKQVKELFPEAYNAYMESPKVLGFVSMASVGWRRIVFNGITQESYGRDGKQYVDYEAIRMVMEYMDVAAQMSDDYLDRKLMHVAMPKIGAGLGGGDWNVIEKIIEEYSVNFQPVVYTL